MKMAHAQQLAVELLPCSLRRAAPDGSAGKETACNAGDVGSTPGLVRFLGGVNGNPLQYSCWENSINRGAWSATVHGITESDVTEHPHWEDEFLTYCCLLSVY